VVTVPFFALVGESRSSNVYGEQANVGLTFSLDEAHDHCLWCRCLRSRARAWSCFIELSARASLAKSNLRGADVKDRSVWMRAAMRTESNALARCSKSTLRAASVLDIPEGAYTRPMVYGVRTAIESARKKDRMRYPLG